MDQKLSATRLWIALLLFLPILSYAQNHARLQTRETSRKGTYYSRQSATVKTQKPYEVMPGFTFTSVSLRIAADQSFSGAYVVFEEDTFLLQKDEHQPADDTLKQANLIILDKPASRILFYPGSIQGDVIFSFMNADTGKKKETLPQKNQRRKEQSQSPEGQCSEPALIEQAEWRAGLPAPSYRRINTLVKHVIVHHAATHNTYTNYENVVRNIYLFHTADRGWSDIGYNYLIAQDGTIFEGRSSGEQDTDRDNILGAHFCGQNSGTMGVCLLGNYETAVPTEEALSALVNLTTWKLNKEGLNPFNKMPHPANTSLGVIAGHRDGCATECPGEHLYARLDEVRLSVKERMTEICQPSFTVYPVPSYDKVFITVPDMTIPYDILLYDMRGQRIQVPIYQEERQWAVDTRLLAAGIYIIKIQGENFNAEQKVILLHNS